MNEFKNLTLVVLASTELDSLKQTIRLLLENCAAEDIAEVMIFLISADCPSAAVAAENDPSPRFKAAYILMPAPPSRGAAGTP